MSLKSVDSPDRVIACWFTRFIFELVS